MIEAHCSRRCAQVLSCALHIILIQEKQVIRLKYSLRINTQTIASGVVIPVDHHRNNWWLLFEQHFGPTRISQIQSSRTLTWRVDNDLSRHNHYHYQPLEPTYILSSLTRSNREKLEGQKSSEDSEEQTLSSLLSLD